MTKIDQENHIIELMLAGRWHGGRTSEELSKLWGIHPRTVADRALVASGVVQRRGKPIEEFIDRKLAELEGMQAAAMNEVKWFVVKGELISKPAQNVMAAAKVVELQAKIKGALVQRHEVKASPSMTSKLSASELLEQLRAEQDERARAIQELEEKVREQAH